ncbi:cryptochrome/photolyase family protein [Streptacidiphilus jiangxiensis]|uniref:Deoxyribodipyrimidine photolyase-related protein n=1 Tax=Streptacidiphilus jiangxiensis TaxID=235985 RepID=A0A1H7ZDP3_STRJI|nr:cryptochrome/photolyase family protein [Streptacidiphilus jiangxiensis]SEM55639.1 deoxyribodipyrimidine photolyase-related protein [Streptacidiphilus jiangxiensis]
MCAARPHWLFADQLGPHFLREGDAGPDPDAPVVLVESRAVLRRRVFHRAKAHLVLSALRHRAAELGDRARYVRADTYREGLRLAVGASAVTVHHPTSRAALKLVESLPQVRVLPARGFLTDFVAFRRWADGRGRRRLLLEDFYHAVRVQCGLLMDGGAPVGGRWNLDAENRERPPRGAERLPVEPPWWPQEDEIDEEVRADLDRWERRGEVRFLGRDGPRRFPVTRGEAQQALDRFLAVRLPAFGRFEDAMLAGDPWMAHSLLSVPLNLGLLDPLECVRGAEAAHRAGAAPLNSVEGFVRQIAGWREYVWHLYWYFGDDYRHANALDHREPVPAWFADLDADAVEAACLRGALAQVRDTGWTHHIPRLMLLGNWALQHGWNPREVTDWFHRAFVDGYDWVMVPNVVGMSQHADGGRMTTKPYLAGGSYIHRMSDFCGACRYRPQERTGPAACPVTTGYWAFVAGHRALLEHNPRTARTVAQLDGLSGIEDLLAVERRRGGGPP